MHMCLPGELEAWGGRSQRQAALSPWTWARCWAPSTRQSRACVCIITLLSGEETGVREAGSCG